MNHRRTLVRLAGPVYLELLAGVAAGIINMVWVARLGGDAVAAVAVATNVENLLLGVVLMAASGTTVLVARARGADDPGALRTAVRGGAALGALLVPPVAVGGWLLRDPLAALLLGGADHPAHALATAYFAISLPGMAVFFATTVLDGVLKGTGDTRTPMRLAFLANGLILLLDPLLVHGYGVEGAAVSTVIGRTAALAAGLVALRRNALLKAARAARPSAAPRGTAPLKAAPEARPAAALRRTALPRSAGSARRGGTLRGTALVKAVRAARTAAALRRTALPRSAGSARPGGGTVAALRRTAALGLPMSVDFVVRMGGALALVSVIARLGVTEIAAYGIATKAMYVATMAFYAVRQAASIHTAHLLGAGHDERGPVGRQALVLGGVLGAGAAGLLLLGAGPVMRGFGAEPAVAAAGALFLRCLGPYLLLMAGFIALAGVFEGSGDSPRLARITVVGVLLQLPLAYVLSGPLGLGLAGICLAMALAMAAQCTALGLLRRRTHRPAAAAGQRAEAETRLLSGSV
ncbi:MATE family efflux transporter [Streptomyces sp. NPDC101160]|uniref:MATE family efflux transporter n=1 Tax=Streptomyces sp. NPDC101160 TaxID=3366118 RepID=UPI0038273279